MIMFDVSIVTNTIGNYLTTFKTGFFLFHNVSYYNVQVSTMSTMSSIRRVDR